ncbi:hypothetical protein RUM43_014553 [Polyplax serrata]|uniref:S1 motif domain-containing protein n=1 Tax=Polyplax serrata TaxID=468196 RepID=A0AAN8RXT8_POLSC
MYSPQESEDYALKNSNVKNEMPKKQRKRRHGSDGKIIYPKKSKVKRTENLASSSYLTVAGLGLRRRKKSEELLARSEKIDVSTACGIMKLFDEGNTIPFLVRYRKNLIGNLDSNKLRSIKSTYEWIKKLDEKATQALATLNNSGASSIVESILNAESVEEIDILVAPFKKQKRRLAQKARDLNLEKPAQDILNGTNIVNLENYVNKDELKDVKMVKLGIQHIISDLFCKDSEIQQLLRKIVESRHIKIYTKEKKVKCKKEENPKLMKYEIYRDFSQSVTHLKPHQILAISRGEAENELSVKVEIPYTEWQPVTIYCEDRWLTTGIQYELRKTVVMGITPLVERRIRSRLKKKAEEEAINVFGSNLRQLLLTPPCKGFVIMGIDPGFYNGCKVAVISPQGVPFKWTKFYLPNSSKIERKAGGAHDCEIQLKTLVLKYKCEIIALGNGKGCRETESLLNSLIKKKAFQPIDVSYTIISEQGVSFYSCSSEAATEFPDLDPTFVGAVSLARRLQDPLSELVKVDPKHLGVGLYQHDVKSNLLSFTLDEIVSECVSFVGVDLNTATLYLLKRVAGLNESKAREILKYRERQLEFQTIDELKKVKGIGEKTFRQCAGFFRIASRNSGSKINPLDQTIIHPESYEAAVAIAENLKFDLSKTGTNDFIANAKSKLKTIDVGKMAKKFGIPDSDVTIILDAFTKPVNYDIRNPRFGPFFRKNISRVEDLSVGQILTGVVQNVVPFGAFVDVGCTISGLIHSSKMNGKMVALNDRVSVKLLSIDLERKRLGLELKEKLNFNCM